MYKDIGEFGAALIYQKKALDIDKEIFGESHSRVAFNYNNLSMIYQEMGELEAALNAQETSVNLIGNVLPPNHPNLIGILQNLSSIQGERKK